MEKILNKIIDNNRYLIKEGAVADYIPALLKANPNHIGICVMDVDGNIYKAGDYTEKFTIQSISKVMSLMLALIDNGEDQVFKKIDYEPTEEPFNTLFKLDFPHTIKPSNPMINSGAIVTTSLIKGEGEERFNRLLTLIRTVTENPNISYNEEVYLSEKETGNKNRAMAYLMKSRGFIEGDVEDILDTYFKQCSIEVTAVDIARIGLFIANRCKLSKGDRICDNKTASILTAIMATCGMYNFSGEYASTVGIPSKSGVGGGILGTIPYKMGIGVFSPALDQYGNSIAGYGIMADLSKELNLNIF
ncbi:glutaminase A [Tissierella pigra]|uniref:Glutaminase n=1 Tax=Tissierella pigra TaxID=2607614 RepID=A0A6N7Y117_9FIRM|nr:glutaminase A [Tissierella pigra]MBU5426363.1 glutaminase A [Tissierella pigra]MSU02188.1 glutaminase A [Tissierella pigra]